MLGFGSLFGVTLGAFLLLFGVFLVFAAPLFLQVSFRSLSGASLAGPNGENELLACTGCEFLLFHFFFRILGKVFENASRKSPKKNKKRANRSPKHKRKKTTRKYMIWEHKWSQKGSPGRAKTSRDHLLKGRFSQLSSQACFLNHF